MLPAVRLVGDGLLRTIGSLVMWVGSDRAGVGACAGLRTVLIGPPVRVTRPAGRRARWARRFGTRRCAVSAGSPIRRVRHGPGREPQRGRRERFPRPAWG